MSLLRKYVGDHRLILPLESMGVKDILTYEKILVEILDRQAQKLRNKQVVSVKIL